MGATTFSIGVDGGATKTELILVDAKGTIVASVLSTGSNPSVSGKENARSILREGIQSLIFRFPSAKGSIQRTLLCMAGSPALWQEITADFKDCGTIDVVDDSLPVLELATDGKAGLAIHSGTGSFVAARGNDGAAHYTGGLGWRFGDPGSAYDIGEKCIGRALVELQGWEHRSLLSDALCDYVKLSHATEITRMLYHHPQVNAQISGFSRSCLSVAEAGDKTARKIILDSAVELMRNAKKVATKLFPKENAVRAGLSGRILNTPFVFEHLQGITTLRISGVTLPPIEGVRRLLARAASETRT